MIQLSRRGFIGGLLALAAPAVIRTPGLLMPIKGIISASNSGLSEVEVNHFITNFSIAYMQDASMFVASYEPIPDVVRVPEGYIRNTSQFFWRTS